MKYNYIYSPTHQRWRGKKKKYCGSDCEKKHFAAETKFETSKEN